MTLIINLHTKQQLDALLPNLPQSLLLSGPLGVGLGTIARHLAADKLVRYIAPITKNGQPHSLYGTISKDEVRQLYEVTRSRTMRSRVIIIDDADRMTQSAQTAFLKLLEEPTFGTHYILTSHTPARLNQTILSRVSSLNVRPPTSSQTDALLKTYGDIESIKRRQVTFIASGHPAEICRLLIDDTYFFKVTETMTDARTLITGSLYEKVKLASKYHQNPEGAIRLVDGAIFLRRHVFRTTLDASSVDALSRLLDVRERLLANTQPRLQLTALML